MLDDIGVEVIEAGFPVVSPYEKQCVSAIAHMGLEARICCLARARREDVEAAVDCGVDIISIFIGTSDLHIRTKFRKPREEVLAEAIRTVEMAGDQGLKVRFAAEDASRTDPAFLKQVYRQAEDAGAHLLSFADTVGCLVPMEVAEIMKDLTGTFHRPFCHPLP